MGTLLQIDDLHVAADGREILRGVTCRSGQARSTP